jgi:hypothetical protein
MAQNKDQQIIAQSSLKLTQEWAAHCGYCLSLKDLVSVSVVLADYAENGYSKEIGERLKKVDGYLLKEYK